MEENKKPSNPEAFPVLDPNGSFWNPGMSLRDYFANSAMQGIMSSGFAEPVQQYHFDNIAEDSYKIADAMLKQREL